LPIAVRLVLVLASAGLYGLSFPPYGHALLAWIALVPFLVALDGAPARTAVALAWISGIVMAWSITAFLPRAVTVYYDQSRLFGAALFVAIVSVMCCPSHMLFAWWYRAPRRRRGWLGALAVAAAWVAAELVRTRVGGNPWGTLAYTQARIPVLTQIAEATGPYGTSFAVVAVNAALADALRAARRSSRRSAVLGPLAAAAAVVALVVAFGAARLRASDVAGTAPAVRVAVVQGNIDIGSQWRQELYGVNLTEYLRLTMQAVRDEHPALVVWPENAMTFFLDDEPLYRRVIGNVLTAGNVELVAGGPRKHPSAPETYFNSTFVVRPSGDVAARYDKQMLVPFAEYFPFASVSFLNRRFGAVRQFSPGERAAPVETVAGRAAVVTCNEALFPELVAARVRAGADYVVNLANDAWLSDRTYSERVLDVTALRAVEERRWLVRASASGTSALIDPWGRVVAKAEPFTAAVIAGDVRPSTVTTPYARFGDAFAILCALVAVAAGFARREEPSARDGDVAVGRGA
jgi:apolipoprotein N-acyltransferase